MKLINFYKLFPLLFTLIFLNCEGDGIVDRTIFHPTFKGITYTNEDSPDPISEDISDWQLALDSPYQSFFFNYDIFEGDYYTHTPNDSFYYAIPTDYDIFPAYPNPAQSYINITYTLPRIASVIILIIDSDNRVIRSLINDIHQAGHYVIKWDFKDSVGRKVSSNIYRCIYRIGPWFGQGDIWLN